MKKIYIAPCGGGGGKGKEKERRLGNSSNNREQTNKAISTDTNHMFALLNCSCNALCYNK